MVACIRTIAFQGGEAAWAGEIDILAPDNLIALINHFKGAQILSAPKPLLAEDDASYPDLKDIKGQESAKRALEIAAAGGHNLLMIGPPGSGKSMLAARLPGLLPPLDPSEALEVSMVHSLAGQLPNGRLRRRARRRTDPAPLRAPGCRHAIPRQPRDLCTAGGRALRIGCRRAAAAAQASALDPRLRCDGHDAGGRRCRREARHRPHVRQRQGRLSAFALRPPGLLRGAGRPGVRGYSAALCVFCCGANQIFGPPRKT